MSHFQLEFVSVAGYIKTPLTVLIMRKDIHQRLWSLHHLLRDKKNIWIFWGGVESFFFIFIDEFWMKQWRGQADIWDLGQGCLYPMLSNSNQN